MTFLLHLTTETEPDAMTKSVNAKILHLFSMARRLMTEDKVTYTQPRFALQMDIDFGFNNIPQGEDFFMRMAFWMVEVCAFSVVRSRLKHASAQLSRHKPIPPVGNAQDGPYDLFARMPQEFTMDDFQKCALFFHRLVNENHRKGPNGVNLNMPVGLVMHAFLDVLNPLDSIFTRMDFSTPLSSKVVCFGEYHAMQGTCEVSTYFEEGKEVYDEARCRTLKRLFTRDVML